MFCNPYVFLFVYLPVAWLGYLLVGRWQSKRVSLGWLTLCSVAAYGLWNPMYLAMIIPSIGVNYVLAVAIKRQLEGADGAKRAASWLLRLGIVLNLLFLGYFKYKNFFLETSNELFGGRYAIEQMILPLGISFITFQKIAFLLDIRARKAEFDVADFLAFVFFFPQLTSGPIVHFREVMPQFVQNKFGLVRQDVLVGASLLAIGLFKKVVLADGIEGYVTPVFSAAEHGQAIGLYGAWIGALGFSFQIYFDFSGYSDMAIGLARLFGIRLPINFNSPFKSSNMIDFWTRWHMSLSRFLNTYIYMPVMLRMTSMRTRLGKPMLTNKRLAVGAFASVVMAPTMLTMFLSGIWHGANATFLLWGLLHGTYLCVNQAWRSWRPKWDRVAYDKVMAPVGFVLTFLAVMIAIVIFRAQSLGAAAHVLRGIVGLDGGTSAQTFAGQMGSFGGLLGSFEAIRTMSPELSAAAAAVCLAVLFLLATVGPNSQELLRDFAPAHDYPPKKSAAAAAAQAAAEQHGWNRIMALKTRWNPAWTLALALLFVLGCAGLSHARGFIYWRF